MSAKWYCVQTRRAMDHIAERELTNQGFEVYFPRFIPRGREAVEYLFRGYGFVFFSLVTQRWRCIYGTYGVRKLMGGHPERPDQVRASAIEKLRAQGREGDGVIDWRVAPPDLTGQTLQLNTGPFSSFQGVCEMSTQDRVRLRLSMFGREVPVEALRADVEVVG